MKLTCVNQMHKTGFVCRIAQQISDILWSIRKKIWKLLFKRFPTKLKSIYDFILPTS